MRSKRSTTCTGARRAAKSRSTARANSTSARSSIILEGAGYLAGALVAFLAGRKLSKRWTRLEVHGESMSPAVREGDWLIARKLSAGTPSIVAGDIVVAHDPRDGRAIVKRVEWADAGYVSLLGDNAAASRDSRHFGPLDAGIIESVVVFRYWPPGRIGRIR